MKQLQQLEILLETIARHNLFPQEKLHKIKITS